MQTDATPMQTDATTPNTQQGAERLWKLVNEGGDSYVNALGALTGALRR